MQHLISFVTALMVCACSQIPPAEVLMPSETNKQAVVLDIDGTLTPDVASVFEARPGAAQAVNAFTAKGYKIIYLTARIPLFQANLPGWLQQNDFPKGSLHVAQSAEERKKVAMFKARILDEYLQRGWRLAYAYGDSSTDFDAYARAGIEREYVFALRRQGYRDCQNGVYRLCLNGWPEHLPFIQQEVPDAK